MKTEPGFNHGADHSHGNQLMSEAPPPRISFADLMERARSFPPEVRAEKNRLTFTLAVSVIRHFFGKQWFEDHIFQDAEHSRPPGFMRIDYAPGFEGERKTSRLLDFAETLFNLQHIEGFDERVDQMRSGQVEATFAEFDFARFLYIHDIAFKFVTPTGVTGKITISGLRMRTDAKHAPMPSVGWKALTFARIPSGTRSTRRGQTICRRTSPGSSS